MKTAWDKYQNEKLQLVMDFSEGYKAYLTNGKTERECTKGAIELAKQYGYKDLYEVNEVKAGDKLYVNNRDKGLCLFVVGQEDIAKGMNILGAHIDSPRVDIKQNPLYESTGGEIMISQEFTTYQVKQSLTRYSLPINI